MQDAPPSPRAARLARPGWLDTRLVLGVLLVLGSIVAGARLTASAEAAQAVWVADRDLAAGTTLAPGDLRPGRVRLFDSGQRYLLAEGPEPVGYALRHGLAAGELVPRGALARPGEQARATRDVSVPVAPGHLPDDLQAGQQVDVYVSPPQGGTAPAPAQAGPTRLVLSRVPVALRPRAGGLGTTGAVSVVLSVPDQDATTLVAAVQEGRVDLVRVPRGQELADLGGAPAAG